MKKAVRLPYLAVSVLSLGVVGLAGFAPVVNAAPTTVTQPSTFTVNIAEGVGIDPADKPDGVDSALANVSLNLNARTTGVVTTGGSILNNTGVAATVTVEDADDNTNLVNGANNIPTKAGVLNATTASWGIQKGVAKVTDALVAVPAKGGAAIDVAPTNTTGKQNFTVTYGASSGDAVKGSYKDTLTYTMTAGN